jgi:hypothetical protein
MGPRLAFAEDFVSRDPGCRAVLVVQFSQAVDGTVNVLEVPDSGQDIQDGLGAQGRDCGTAKVLKFDEKVR